METTITTVTTTAPTSKALDATLLAGQCAPSTIAMYQRDAAAYLAWCKSESVAPVDSISLARWRAHLATDTTMSPNTINRMLSAVKRIVREGASQGFTTQENAACCGSSEGCHEGQDTAAQQGAHHAGRYAPHV